MRKTYVKKVIFMTLMSMVISMPVYASWNKENDKWTWIENDQKAIGWKQINNKWYHFGEDSYMNTGWIQDNNKWYLLSNDGIMLTEWQQMNGDWYYFDKSGVMQSGWIDISGTFYFFDEHGSMKTGWIKDNDKWYHISSDGSMDKGWKEIDGEWYMFDEHGVMCTGWIEDKGTWYYADINGRLEKGDISIDGKIYTFAEDGAMLNGLDVGSKNESTDKPLIDVNYSKTGYVNTNSDSLNIRSSANLNSSIIDKLPKGSEVNITGESQNGFYPIDFNGQTAWVSSEWISFEKPAYTQQNILNSSTQNLEENTESDKTIALGGIRSTAPDLNDIHYYSDSNIFYRVRLSPPFLNSSGNPIKGNCTWYAWGRAWELTGKQPVQANFIGNAYEWWNANIATGKYKYGLEPKVGSIAVWNSSLPGSGGCGHVAVVEKIDNGKIYISESMWHGDCFKYQEIYSTEYIYGYIYLDEPNY